MFSYALLNRFQKSPDTGDFAPALTRVIRISVKKAIDPGIEVGTFLLYIDFHRKWLVTLRWVGGCVIFLASYDAKLT